jgi:quinol monooxygenase YgiN
MGQSNENMNDVKTFSTEVIRYKIADDQKDNFINAYTQASKYLRSSKYCLGYSLIQGDEEPNNFVVIIYWSSKDDHLNGFRKSADFSGFFNLVKPFYNDIQEMKHYNSKFEWKKEKI